MLKNVTQDADRVDIHCNLQLPLCVLVGFVNDSINDQSVHTGGATAGALLANYAVCNCRPVSFQPLHRIIDMPTDVLTVKISQCCALSRGNLIIKLHYPSKTKDDLMLN